MEDGGTGRQSLTLAIYVEGGGKGKAGPLRIALRAFLSSVFRSATALGWQIKIVECQGRGNACNCFLRARNLPDTHALLLVDSEVSVGRSPREHLQSHDRWQIGNLSAEDFHLMVQVMETWLVADPSALAEYYKDGFDAASLPRHTDLEQVSKPDVLSALKKATKGTSKGPYQKLHAFEILPRMSSGTVRGKCRHRDHFLSRVEALLNAATA